MAKFMYLYSGGTYPETPEAAKQVMDAWMKWMGGLGDKLLDGGSPLGEKKFVGGAKDSKVNGFNVVEADSLDGAAALTKDHPHLAAGGAIEIATFVDM